MNEEIISIIESAVDSESEKKGRNGEYAFSCPWCQHPESKKKLWVNLDPDGDTFQAWHCWVCEKSGGSLFSLLDETSAPQTLVERLKEVIDVPAYVSSEDEEDEEEEGVSIDPPEDFTPLWENQNDILFKHAINRLKKRGVNYGDIVKYRMGYSGEGRYKNRIVIPSYDSEGELNYIVGRAIWSSQKPKYKNCSAPKSKIIPFENTINWTFPLTLVEGPFDAISVRRNCVPLLGNRLSDKLEARIIRASLDLVNVVLDPDMRDTATDIAESLIEEGIGVRVVDLPAGKDPDDLGFKKTWELIRNTEVLSRSDLIERRLWST